MKNSLKSFELKDLTKSLIKPFQKTQHPERLEVSLFDLLYIDSYVPVVFCYKGEAEGQQGRSTSELFSHKVAHLKEALSKLLVQYYPFAGRVARTYDGRIRELLCNDEGVPFFEARINEEMDSVLGDVDDFRPMSVLGCFELVGMNGGMWQQDLDVPLPPIYVQVTGFKCGGVALYASFSHQMTDGKGFFDFMHAWSQQAMQGKLSANPVLDRPVMLTLTDFLGESAAAAATSAEPEIVLHASQSNGSSPAAVSEVQKKESNGTSSVSKVHDRTVQTDVHCSATEPDSGHEIGNNGTSREPNGKAVTKSDPGADLRFPLEIALTPKTLLVRKEVIQDLKKQATADNPNDYLTTVDCITSHIWRCLNSLDLQSKDLRQSRSSSRPTIKESIEPGPVEFVLSSAVEGRRRFHDPPLSDDFTGNCLYVFQTPRLAPKELLSQSRLHSARVFHKTVREINPSTWKASLGKTFEILQMFQDTEFRHILLTSWIRFPMYEVEFGQGLGKPFFVGVNFPGGFLPEGYCVFLPPRPGSSAAATLQFGLQTDVLQALLSHKHFRSFFH